MTKQEAIDKIDNNTLTLKRGSIKNATKNDDDWNCYTTVVLKNNATGEAQATRINFYVVNEGEEDESAYFFPGSNPDNWETNTTS